MLLKSVSHREGEYILQTNCKVASHSSLPVLSSTSVNTTNITVSVCLCVYRMCLYFIQLGQE